MKQLIVLDIDATLIDSVPKLIAKHIKHRHYDAFHAASGMCVYKRPYLHKFIDECFKKFNGNVAIWTGASNIWAEFIVTNILRKNMSDFLFVWSLSECESGSPNMSIVKPLAKVWHNFPSFNNHNTFIVDDNIYYGSQNIPNMLIIPPYNIYLECYYQKSEGVLNKLIHELSKLNMDKIKNIQTHLRKINKAIIC